MQTTSKQYVPSLKAAQQFVNKNIDNSDRMALRWPKDKNDYFNLCWSIIQAEKVAVGASFFEEQKQAKHFSHEFVNKRGMTIFNGEVV